MGKDLKGNELGKGLSQRKDGRYEARAKINGETIDIYGTNLAELKKQFNIEKEDRIPIKIWINSWGGDLQAGFTTCDAITFAPASEG